MAYDFLFLSFLSFVFFDREMGARLGVFFLSCLASLLERECVATDLVGTRAKRNGSNKSLQIYDKNTVSRKF